MKQLWLLVGGNGAGKSTFYRLVLEPLGLPFVNADRLAQLVYPDAAQERSYEADLLAEQQRNTLVLSGASFCFETVYSHPSKIDFTARAKALGYYVIMVAIHLEQAELNAARVVQRVREGGHNVPTEKLLTRIPRPGSARPASASRPPQSLRMTLHYSRARMDAPTPVLDAHVPAHKRPATAGHLRSAAHLNRCDCGGTFLSSIPPRVRPLIWVQGGNCFIFPGSTSPPTLLPSFS